MNSWKRNWTGGASGDDGELDLRCPVPAIDQHRIWGLGDCLRMEVQEMVKVPRVVVVPRGEIFEWDCPHCGRTHKTVMKPPVVVCCKNDHKEVRLVALPIKPRER